MVHLAYTLCMHVEMPSISSPSTLFLSLSLPPLSQPGRQLGRQQTVHHRHHLAWRGLQASQRKAQEVRAEGGHGV